MTKPTLEQLDAEIAALEGELAPTLQRLRLLKRLRRPLAAAAASAATKAEKHCKRNARIVLTYGDPGERTYGLRLEIARQQRLDVRTISRIVKGTHGTPKR